VSVTISEIGASDWRPFPAPFVDGEVTAVTGRAGRLEAAVAGAIEPGMVCAGAVGVATPVAGLGTDGATGAGAMLATTGATAGARPGVARVTVAVTELVI
jgi:hypothetical protein